jgi:hypothetical protein
MTGLACAAPVKTQQSYGKAKVSYVYAEQVEDTPDLVLGEFLVQSFLATILFDSRTSHSFISSYFAETHDIPTVALKTTTNQIPWRPYSMPLEGNQHFN